MWTPAARAQLARRSGPHATCLTDAEWELAQPFLPPTASCGRRRRWPMRRLLGAVLYALRTGRARRHPPLDVPPSRPVLRLARSGAFGRTAHALVLADCERAGRGASPAVAVMEAQRGRGAGRPSALSHAQGDAAAPRATTRPRRSPPPPSSSSPPLPPRSGVRRNRHGAGFQRNHWPVASWLAMTRAAAAASQPASALAAGASAAGVALSGT